MSEPDSLNPVTPINAYAAVQQRFTMNPDAIVMLRRAGAFDQMSNDDACDMVRDLWDALGPELAERLLMTAPADYRGSAKNIEPRMARLMNACQNLTQRDALRMMLRAPHIFTRDAETFTALLECLERLIPVPSRRGTFLYSYPGYFSMLPGAVSEFTAEGNQEDATFGNDQVALWKALDLHNQEGLAARNLNTLLMEICRRGAASLRYAERLKQDLGSQREGYDFLIQLMEAGWKMADLHETLRSQSPLRSIGAARIIATQRLLTEQYGVPLARVIVAFIKQPILLQISASELMERINTILHEPTPSSVEELILHHARVVILNKDAEPPQDGSDPNSRPTTSSDPADEDETGYHELIGLLGKLNCVPRMCDVYARRLQKMQGSFVAGSRYINELLAMDWDAHSVLGTMALEDVHCLPIEHTLAHHASLERTFGLERRVVIRLIRNSVALYELTADQVATRLRAALGTPDPASVLRLFERVGNVLRLDEATLERRRLNLEAHGKNVLHDPRLLKHPIAEQSPADGPIVPRPRSHRRRSQDPTVASPAPVEQVQAPPVEEVVDESPPSSPTEPAGPEAATVVDVATPPHVSETEVAIDVASDAPEASEGTDQTDPAPDEDATDPGDAEPSNPDEEAPSDGSDPYQPGDEDLDPDESADDSGLPSDYVARDILTIPYSHEEAMRDAGWNRVDAKRHLKLLPGLREIDPEKLGCSLTELAQGLGLFDRDYTKRLLDNLTVLVYRRTWLRAAREGRPLTKVLEARPADNLRLTADQRAEVKRLAVGAHQFGVTRMPATNTLHQALVVLERCGFEAAAAESFLADHPELFYDDARPLSLVSWLTSAYNLAPERSNANLLRLDARITLFEHPQILRDSMNELREETGEHMVERLHQELFDPTCAWDRIYLPLEELALRYEILIDSGLLRNVRVPVHNATTDVLERLLMLQRRLADALYQREREDFMTECQAVVHGLKKR